MAKVFDMAALTVLSFIYLQVLLEDINECDEYENLCQNGHCTNTFGSFMCSCNDGFRLDDSNALCVGKLLLWELIKCSIDKIVVRVYFIFVDSKFGSYVPWNWGCPQAGCSVSKEVIWPIKELYMSRTHPGAEVGKLYYLWAG